MILVKILAIITFIILVFIVIDMHKTWNEQKYEYYYKDREKQINEYIGLNEQIPLYNRFCNMHNKSKHFSINTKLGIREIFIEKYMDGIIFNYCPENTTREYSACMREYIYDNVIFYVKIYNGEVSFNTVEPLTAEQIKLAINEAEKLINNKYNEDMKCEGYKKDIEKELKEWSC